MKKISQEIGRALGFGVNKAFWDIFTVLASRLTGDKNRKSLKNELSAISLLLIFFLFPLFIYHVSSAYFSYTSSGWVELEKHYYHGGNVQYQKSNFDLYILKNDNDKNITSYRALMMLTQSGLYIRPTSLTSHSPSSTLLLFHSPLFIPWKSIESCRQDLWEPTKIIMPIKEVDISIKLTLWAFLKPLCEERGLLQK